MKFCPKCGSMMFMNSDQQLTCKCGYIQTENVDTSDYVVLQDTKQSNNVRIFEDDIDVGPVTNETCPECGNDKATYKLLQTRSADEAPTRIFTCTKCKHTWRAYD